MTYFAPWDWIINVSSYRREFRELVDALQDTGQLENTLIFVHSDNGPMMEPWPDAGFTPFRGGIGSTWEGGVRVPVAIDSIIEDKEKAEEFARNARSTLQT